MKHTVKSFENLIDRNNITFGLMIPVGLMTVAAALLWIFTPEYFQPGSFWVWVGVISIVGVVFGVHYRYVDTLSRKQINILYFIYHLALITFGVFVAPYLSPFDFLWVILAIGMDLLFGRRWLVFTFTIYVLVLIVTGIKTSTSIDLISILKTFTFITGAISTTLLASRFREISDQERRALDSITHNTSLERQRLLTLINSMGEAVIAFDHSGKILLYNAQVLNILDLNTSLENKNIDRLLKLKDLKKNNVLLTSLANKTQTNFSSEEYSHYFDEKEFINLYIDISTIKLDYGDNDDASYILILRDITNKKSLEDERDEFISVVSHELRTPVAIAEGNLSNAIFFAQKDGATTTTKDALEQAHDKILVLAEMVNDLATLSRAERSNYEMEINSIDIVKFVKQLQDDYTEQAKEKGLMLNVTASKEPGEITVADLYLREIMQNFITNAIKYTKKGNIVINARKSNDSVIFSVSDSGIGMSKNDAKHVYDKFWRSESYETRESSGTGLGLYVTNKIAQKIHARLGLESELGKGSTFSVTVPIKATIDKT